MTVVSNPPSLFHTHFKLYLLFLHIQHADGGNILPLPLTPPHFLATYPFPIFTYDPKIYNISSHLPPPTPTSVSLPFPRPAYVREVLFLTPSYPLSTSRVFSQRFLVSLEHVCVYVCVSV